MVEFVILVTSEVNEPGDRTEAIGISLRSCQQPISTTIEVHVLPRDQSHDCRNLGIAHHLPVVEELGRVFG